MAHSSSDSTLTGLSVARSTTQGTNCDPKNGRFGHLTQGVLSI